MSRRMALSAAVVSVVLLISAVARAQEEQRLQYRTTSADAWTIDQPDSRGQSAEVTAEAPKDVALPKFAGDPIFAKWTTPRAEAGFLWVALDQSKKNGPHDLLYIDANGDGRLADERPVQAPHARFNRHKGGGMWIIAPEGGPGDHEHAEFGPVKVFFKGDDGAMTHQVFVTLFLELGSHDAPRVHLAPAVWYEGTIKIGEETRKCRLIDYNGNGAFNDASTKSRESDVLEIDLKNDGKFVRFFIGKYLQPVIGGPCFLLKLARDGTSITLAPAGEVPIGVFRVPGDTNLVEFVGENGHFRRYALEGPVQVPAGTYALEHIDFTRTDDKGVRWKLVANAFPDTLTFGVKEGETTDVAVGEPLVSSLEIRKVDGGFDFRQVLKGLNAESIYIQRGATYPAPKLYIRNADRSYSFHFSMAYG